MFAKTDELLDLERELVDFLVGAEDKKTAGGFVESERGDSKIAKIVLGNSRTVFAEKINKFVGFSIG